MVVSVFETKNEMDCEDVARLLGWLDEGLVVTSQHCALRSTRSM